MSIFLIKQKQEICLTVQGNFLHSSLHSFQPIHLISTYSQCYFYYLLMRLFVHTASIHFEHKAGSRTSVTVQHTTKKLILITGQVFIYSIIKNRKWHRTNRTAVKEWNKLFLGSLFYSFQYWGRRTLSTNWFYRTVQWKVDGLCFVCNRCSFVSSISDLYACLRCAI